MSKECVWYNGEMGFYEVLDFDPNGLTKEEIIEKAKINLTKRYGDIDLDKVMETVYLIDIDNLEKVN